jgi:nicotinamidase-related amidase
VSHVADTTPYAWPYDGLVEPARTALVVTGCDARWTAAVTDADSVVSTIDVLRRALTPLGVLTVLVGHAAPDTRRGAPEGPPTRPLITVPTPVGDDVALVAAGIDGFYGSALDAALTRARRTHLLMAGFGFETTVHSTLRRANDRGYECLVVADACADVDPSLRRSSISSIEMSGGIFGAVGISDTVLHAFGAAPT